VGKAEKKRGLGRPRTRFMNHIQRDLREMEVGGMDWSDLAQERDQWGALVNTVLNLWIP
jgi:hypothetical protein